MDQDRSRILLVDDDPVLRQLLRGKLAASGFKCDEACDGREALSMYSEVRYPLVITDLRMPHVNGHQLCVELLQHDPPPHIVVITAVLDPRLEADLRRRGVRDFFTKPLALGAFTDHLRGVVARTQADVPRGPLLTAAATTDAKREEKIVHDSVAWNQTTVVEEGAAASLADESPPVDRMPLVPYDGAAALISDQTPPPLVRIAELKLHLDSPIVPARAMSDLILWPTFLFALGTGFGWALHLISTSCFLRW